MAITHLMTAPKLLKSRQYHSRLFAAAAIMLLIFTAPKYDGIERFVMMWLGYALVVIGAFGRVYCSTFIGGRKNDVVVREGPFSAVRNPLYVFSFIAMAGIGLQSGMWSVLALLVLAFAFYYPFVVAKEEAFLEHKFGESYSAYKREVPRWLPNLKLWREPEETSSMPKFIRRTILDAAIFFLPMPCFALIASLQALEIIPVWLTLP